MESEPQVRMRDLEDDSGSEIADFKSLRWAPHPSQKTSCPSQPGRSCCRGILSPPPQLAFNSAQDLIRHQPSYSFGYTKKGSRKML